MVVNRLSGRDSAGDPAGVPMLYPDLDPLQLERFLTDLDYAHIKSFDNVYILPFGRRDDEPAQMAFGFGLSRFMIRNLMLLRDVSIHGPEDTAEVPYEEVRRVVQAHPQSCHVTGVAHFGQDGYSLKVEAHRPGRPVSSTRAEHRKFGVFLNICSTAIARLLGGQVDDPIVEGWNTARPRDTESLVRLGRIHLDFDRRQTAERGLAVKKLVQLDPHFVVPLWDIDEEAPEARRHYFAGLRRDPYNAQLCFQTFCAVWTSKGPQPEALQFCRRAIELSPGHGKAHMCAPHAAQRPAEMLRHSELGYRLLPGNSFAVNNYTLALNRANAPVAKRIELAEEGVANDPCDPTSYDRLIELYTGVGDYEKALATAVRLQKLYEPKMNERALYCLRQNPQRARLIDAGQYDPAAANRRRIAELRERV